MMLQIFLITIVLLLTQAVSFLEQENVSKMVNIDELLEIYKNHFILVRSLTFTLLQDSEHQTELSQVALKLIKKIHTLKMVQEKFLPKGSATLPFHFSPPGNLSIHSGLKPPKEKDFVKIKSLSSDSSEGYVVIAWNVQVLLQFLYESFHVVVPEARATYLLLFVSPDCATFETYLNGVLKLFWVKHHVSNAIGHSLYPCGGTTIYTFHPFVKTMDGTWGLTQGYTKDEIFSDFTLMTNSFSDFQQIPLRVALFERKPTATKAVPKLLNLNPIYQNWSLSDGFSGLDGCLLRELSRFLNFDAVVDHIEGTYGRGFPNGTFTDTLGQLVNHKVHYSANGWFLTDYQTNEIEFTTPYSSDQVCAVAPKAPRVPPWKSLIFCFDLFSWIFIFFMCGLCVLFWYILNANKRTSVIFWEMYSVLFGIPVRMVLLPNQYFFVASCLVFNIIIMGVIQGSVFTDFTTVVYYKDINTLEELDESGLSIATSTWYLDYDSSELMKSLKKKQVEKTEESFGMAAHRRNVAVLYRKQDAEYLVNVKYLGVEGSPLLHIVNECLHSFLIVNVLQKGSPFLKTFNNVIAKLVEGGLPQKWYNDGLEAGSREKLLEKNIEEFKRIGYLDDVQLAFHVLALGYLVSALAFLHERFRMKNIKI